MSHKSAIKKNDYPIGKLRPFGKLRMPPPMRLNTRQYFKEHTRIFSGYEVKFGIVVVAAK